MDFISMSWDTELEEKIKQCTFSCFAIRKSYQRAITINTNSHFIHEGFDEFTNYPIETDNKYNVSFIGNLRSERIPFYRSYDFHISNDAYGTKHNEVVASSYINLNFTSGEGTSDRTYKVLAANGFLLTQPWEDMDLDFDKTLDFDVFNTPEEMKEKIYYYLKNKDQRTKTANHGYKTVQKYTRTNWAKGIIELYERYR
jgi:spore maturation protein CgeB